MPLPTDEKLLALSEKVLHQFDAMFKGPHPGLRPVHAKGLLVSGNFIPAASAKDITRAAHITRRSTPVLARFSDAPGLPDIPDPVSDARPNGLAVRFQLAEHVHTDIISHSIDGFPTRTGEEFLEFIRAAAASDPAHPEDSPLQAFLGSHPAAHAFVQTPKPAPSSFARQSFYGVTAMRFTNQQGKSRYGRYRILPDGGNEYLDHAAAKAPNYLFEEITQRIATKPVIFRIFVQLAEDGDTVDDATIHWPKSRPVVEFGTLTLAAVVPDNAAQQKQIIFDPIPRLDGIEPSADPLLELRAAIYLMSGLRRRSA
jgi:catalase